MPEIYRKFGRTVRYEHGVFVRVEESGEAIEDGETFSVGPTLSRPGPAGEPVLRSDEVRATVDALRGFDFERLVVTEGVATHEFGDRRWTEHTRRIHASIAHPPHRAIIDLGDFDVSGIATIADAMRRCGAERDAPQRIRLAPNVSAALLPSLAGVAPPNVRVTQTAQGVDGKGEPIVDGGTGWYRPSYRARPVRLPFHLRAECDVTAIDDDLPRAVALLAPVDGLVLHVLCIDGDDVFPATVRVTRIDAVGPPVRWYPYGAGSFGSEMML